MASKSDKTEDPTARRKREARREGRVPRSREVPIAVSLLAIAVAGSSIIPNALAKTATIVRFGLSTAGGPHETLEFAPVGDMVLQSTLAWAPLVGLVVAAGVAAHFAQGGGVMYPKTSRVSLKNLDPKRGLQALSPKKAGWEIVRAALKAAVVGAFVAVPLTSMWETTQGRSLQFGEGLHLIGEAAGALTFRVAVAAVLVAAVDYGVQQRRVRSEIRMTKQEVRDEYRSTEGDPNVRAARRRRAQEISRRRSFADIASADVVITNPTHFAVVLAYAPGSPAPRVVAKGMNAVAAKIRKEARRNGIPIVENKPLARALYRQVRVGGWVPEAHFGEVIAALVRAYTIRGRFPQAQAAGPSAGRTEDPTGPDRTVSRQPGGADAPPARPTSHSEQEFNA